MFTLICHNAIYNPKKGVLTTQFSYATREEAEEHLNLCLKYDNFSKEKNDIPEKYRPWHEIIEE